MSIATVPSQRSLRPGLNKSVPEIRAHLVRNGPPSYTGKGVIVGVIDSGIDLFHRCFRKPDGNRPSRVLWIWDQTLGPTGAQHSPPGFTGGVEFDSGAIETALRNEPEAFPHKDTTGHGTWVAGIAAGNGAQAGRCHFANTYIGVAPNADIIVVKVPTDPVDHSVMSAHKAVVEAARYIFAKAGTRPVVINISLQDHPSLWFPDGTSDLDTGLDGLLAGTTGRAIVTIPGNYGDSRDHVFGEIAPNDTLERRFFNIPGMASPAAHVHYSSGADLELTLISPASHTFGPVPLTPTAVMPLAPGQETVTLTHESAGHHVLTIAPGPGGMVTPGTWKLKIHERAGGTATVNIWAESMSMKFFYGPDGSHVEPQDPAGRKAQADDRSHTMASPGTAKNVITVGAHDISDGTLCKFSGRGPAVVPTVRDTPDVTAPGIGIAAPRSGAEGLCFCCDWWLRFYNIATPGTSFAAPHVTGVVALMLERNGHQTFDQIRQRLRMNARDPGMPTLPDYGWGWGKVDAYKAVMDTPVPGGGGGGPGGGGPDHFTDDPVILPFAAETATFWPTPERLASFIHQLSATPIGQTLAALVSTHVDEVQRLINSNCRIATLWHRIDAPAVLRALVAQFAGEPPRPYPTLSRARRDYPRRLLERLSQSGSAALRADIAAHQSLVLDLIGAGPDLRALFAGERP